METGTKREREKAVVETMIRLYCRGNHDSRGKVLCPQCAELKDYAFLRTDRCPFMEEKTFCSNCRVHCYRPDMRERIRTVMRYSGPRMVYHHPVLALRHLHESRKEKRTAKAP